MSSRREYLYEDRIESIVSHACLNHNPRLYPKVIINNNRELRIEIRELEDSSVKQKNDKPGLLIFNFSKGMTACQVQGNTKYRNVGEEILDEVVQGAKMTSLDFSHKSVTFHGVEAEVYNTIKTLLKEDERLSISDHSFKQPTVADMITVSGKYNSHITLTYYNTKTLLMQGCVSTLFVTLFCDIKSCLTTEDTSLDGTFISLMQHPSKEWISSDLSVHFPDRTKFSGTVCESLISTSIKLLNSDIVISDYSSMIHGIFRAIEIVIGKKIGEVSPYTNTGGRPDTIGRDFDKKMSPKVFKSEFTYFDGNTALKSAIEDAYNHYYIHRHATFHADLLVPTNTVIIENKEDAVDLAIDSLEMIRAILDNW